MQIKGKHGPGMPKMTWKTQRETYMSGNSMRLTLLTGMCGDPMCAGSQLPGGEPTDVNLNAKMMMMMMMMMMMTLYDI